MLVQYLKIGKDHFMAFSINNLQIIQTEIIMQLRKHR
jgi:hypothetical protein